MLRLVIVAVGVVIVVSCGAPKPEVTVPAPVAVVSAEPPTAGTGGLVPPQPTLRLPRNFVPTGYTARLAIDPQREDFDGSMQIAGTISELTSVIWLHGKELQVSKAIARRDGVDVPLTVTAVGEDLLRVAAQSPLDAGAWTLTFDYKGKFDVLSTVGAFKQTVADHSYVFTQLEAIYARRVFPCLDEPDNKVPWQLTLDVPKALIAVSNTPEKTVTPLDPKTKRVEFAISKPLPTYLLAFGVGPFEVIDAGKSRHGVPLRVLTLAKRAADGAWAAKTTPIILNALEDWFGIPYPYEKLDQLSIPMTVGFGAMENAGLITYTETLMLLDPQRQSKQRQHVWVRVAAHEMGHQWFGNLVTMAFWDDIWLNEGFANWVETKVTNKVDASYRDDQSGVGLRNEALSEDGLVSARQIRQPIESVNDIFTAFDGITYNKGASVLAMFEAYLGPAKFQQGVRDYLAAKSWGNATSKDFAAAMTKASGKEVEAAFASFLEQPGAPEITATLECKGGKSQLALSQRRYVPPGAPAAESATPWILPICVAYDKGGKRAEACTLLSQPTGALELETKTCPRWVMPNKQGAGYNRNRYTPPQVTALRDEAWAKLTWTERRVLYFDVADAATIGKLPLQLAFSMVPKLLAGNDRFTAGPALELVTGLENFVPADLRGKYDQWIRSTFGPGATKIGFVPKATDTLDTETLRAQLVGTVAWLGREPKLVAEAVKLSDNWRDLPQSIRGLVLVIAVDAKQQVFDTVMKDVVHEGDRTRRQEMLQALAQVRDPVRQKAALGLMLDTKLDIRETRYMVFGGSTEPNRAVAREFFKTNMDTIMARLPKDETASPLAIVSAVFTSSCDAKLRDATAAYVTKTFAKLSGGERIVKQQIEGMDQCIARRKLIEPELRAWLGGLRVPKP
ncbi:MAG: M1 family metallopeptidase [Kofleriaceae bacterium]